MTNSGENGYYNIGSESVNHCLNKSEGLHHFKSFHFPVVVPSPLVSFNSEVQFFIPVKTLMAPWTKLPSPLVNACIRFPNKCGQASGQSQYAMAEIAYAWICGNKYKSTSVEEDLQMYKCY